MRAPTTHTGFTQTEGCSLPPGAVRRRSLPDGVHAENVHERRNEAVSLEIAPVRRSRSSRGYKIAKVEVASSNLVIRSTQNRSLGPVLCVSGHLMHRPRRPGRGQDPATDGRRSSTSSKCSSPVASNSANTVTIRPRTYTRTPTAPSSGGRGQADRTDGSAQPLGRTPTSRMTGGCRSPATPDPYCRRRRGEGHHLSPPLSPSPGPSCRLIGPGGDRVPVPASSGSRTIPFHRPRR